MNSPDALISVVVPVYNERETLPELHRQLTAVMSSTGYPYELVLVDDGSRDGSTRMIRELVEQDARVVGIRLSRNFGHEPAIQAGLEQARGDAVIVMDADLQDAPDALPRMIQAWEEGADVAYAVRRNRKENFLYRAAFTGFYRIARRISAIDLPRDAGPFSLMSRAVVDQLVAMPEHGRYFPGLRAFTGFTQVAVEVERNPRLAGETKYSLRRRTAGALNALLSFSKLPLRMVTILGFVTWFVSMLGIAWVVAGKFLNPNLVPGWVSLMVVVLLVSGLQMLTLGIVGEYVGKVYEEVRRRPSYIVAERWETDAVEIVGEAPDRGTQSASPR